MKLVPFPNKLIVLLRCFSFVVLVFRYLYFNRSKIQRPFDGRRVRDKDDYSNGVLKPTEEHVRWNMSVFRLRFNRFCVNRVRRLFGFTNWIRIRIASSNKTSSTRPAYHREPRNDRFETNDRYNWPESPARLFFGLSE